jgi:large conductance mechanosensitive channel
MSLASEFKEFAMKGSVAFGKIVNSLVGDVIMPPIGLAIGGVNFTDLAVQIGTSPKGAPVLFKYGAFIQTVFEFLIIALALFMVIKAINRLKRPSPTLPVPPTKTEALLQDIRDQLAKR